MSTCTFDAKYYLGKTVRMFCCRNISRFVFALLGRCYLVTVVCFLMFLPVESDESCPACCVCARDSGTVTCHEGDEPVVPEDVPGWTTTLILRGNNISTLPGSAFSPNGTELDLTTLALSHNGIRAIEACAFSGLPRLHVLDLSHNRLAFLSRLAFDGLRELRSLYLNGSLTPSGAAQLASALEAGSLRSLHRLELAGNRLKTIPIWNLAAFNLHALVLSNNSFENIGMENVSSLYRFERLRVYLALNPFRCSCGLEAFFYWLRNSSQCQDAARLLCFEPEARRGVPVERLREEDVDCLNENLEAVSYVFLGIVLALIGVVFLMVLYLNREGIKRWINNIREACRDQMEVYHYRYEQDSDPRLANVSV